MSNSTLRLDDIREALNRMIAVGRADDFVVMSVGESCVQFAFVDTSGLHGEVLDLAEIGPESLQELRARGWQEADFRVGEVVIWVREFAAPIDVDSLAHETQWIFDEVFRIGGIELDVRDGYGQRARIPGAREV